MMNSPVDGLSVALPSKGALYEATMSLLKNCGLPPKSKGERSYESSIKTLPGSRILYQRATEIPAKVNEGTVDVGITGLDLVTELGWGTRAEDRKLSNLSVVLEDLGYGSADLVLAVPNEWIDITSIGDLADLALQWRSEGHTMRIATKFLYLTSDFLDRRGINHFMLVPSEGATEITPKLGLADLISDNMTTGSTLAANNLRPLSPAIFRSQACLVVNRDIAAHKLEQLQTFIDLIESHLRAQAYYLVVANIDGTLTPPGVPTEWVYRQLATTATRGMTLSEAYGSHNSENTSLPDGSLGNRLSVVVPDRELYDTVQLIRKMHGRDMAVFPMKYFFETEALGYAQFIASLPPTAKAFNPAV
jgi:ATP phosphoribosyltransferase